MKVLCLFLSSVFLSAICFGERQPLWPEGEIPDFSEKQIAAMADVAKSEGFVRAENTMPYLEWFDSPVSNKNGVCMILISGGGYGSCCDMRYIETWSRRLTDLGVTCVSLVYRTPRHPTLEYYRSAWQDGQRAVRKIRAQAASRGLDPNKIGTMSMSAGSHLATLLATSSKTPAYEKVDELDDLPCNINFACTFAIAYGMTDGLGGRNSREGDGVDVTLDPLFKFDESTCPMWMSHGGIDPYSPLASTYVYRRLRARKVPAEVHLYADTSHYAVGFDRAVEFMRQMGFLETPMPEVALEKRYFSDSSRDERVHRYIWPEGKTPDFQKQQCKPYLEWHIPKTLKTKAVQIIWSGGSYNSNSPDWFEVSPVRRYLNEKGMTVVTVKYRTPRPAAPLKKHVTAWQDIQRAIRIVKSEAKRRGLDPDRVGIMGSSAGGHLALMGATSSCMKSYLPIDELDKIPCNVAWAVAIYPAYALEDGLESPNKEGGNAVGLRLAREFAFDLKTAPILFIHGDADNWAAMNSVSAWEQLRRMGIQGELHTLATRKHCFQRKASPGTGSYTWLDRIWEFLTKKDFVEKEV